MPSRTPIYRHNQRTIAKSKHTKTGSLDDIASGIRQRTVGSTAVEESVKSRSPHMQARFALRGNPDERHGEDMERV